MSFKKSWLRLANQLSVLGCSTGYPGLAPKALSKTIFALDRFCQDSSIDAETY
jgi:hypothetical protein